MLIAVGLNRKCATVADREALALPADRLDEALNGLAALGGVDEVAFLSTCYRVEIFATTRCPSAATVALRAALQARAGRELPLFELHGEAAFRHLVRVASSLESAILGEPQIQGQVKDAFQRALAAGAAGKELVGILNQVLQAAKRVRTDSAVGRSGVSWGHAAAALAAKVLGPLAGRRLAMVGADRVRVAQADREAAGVDAERIVNDEVTRYVRAEAERRAAPIIQEIRTRASAIAREEVERTLRRLGEDPEVARRLDAMAGSIVAKILHQPSARLKKAVCDGGRGEALVAAACEIFEVSDSRPRHVA